MGDSFPIWESGKSEVLREPRGQDPGSGSVTQISVWLLGKSQSSGSMALQLRTWALKLVLSLNHSSTLSKSHPISEPQFPHLKIWLLLEINDIRHLAQCLSLSSSSVTLSAGELWDCFWILGSMVVRGSYNGHLLFLVSGCLPRLSLSLCVAVTTQASTWGKALSIWINMVVVCMCPGPGVVACVTKEEFQLSHEVSHWHLGTGGQKSKGACFRGFFCILLVLAHEIQLWKCPFPSSLYTVILLRDRLDHKRKRCLSQTHLDSILFLPLSHSVTLGMHLNTLTSLRQ